MEEGGSETEGKEMARTRELDREASNKV